MFHWTKKSGEFHIVEPLLQRSWTNYEMFVILHCVSFPVEEVEGGVVGLEATTYLNQMFFFSYKMVWYLGKNLTGMAWSLAKMGQKY